MSSKTTNHNRTFHSKERVVNFGEFNLRKVNEDDDCSPYWCTCKNEAHIRWNGFAVNQIMLREKNSGMHPPFDERDPACNDVNYGFRQDKKQGKTLVKVSGRYVQGENYSDEEIVANLLRIRAYLSQAQLDVMSIDEHIKIMTLTSQLSAMNIGTDDSSASGACSVEPRY